MKRPRRGSTPSQLAYATRMMDGNASSKKEAALLSGFSMTVANNAHSKIENTEGYKNAMIGLATKSNNLMLAALSEFEARGLKGFTNAELIKALNAIGSAWERIEKQRAPNKLTTPEGNRLYDIFRRETAQKPVDVEFVEKPNSNDMDF